MINIVCLKWGGAYAPEYVNHLYSMLKRHVTVPFKMTCMTENARGITLGIRIKLLPANMETWWGKLWMFKPGLFPDGQRQVFFDLDTVIVGNIDDILGYDGHFATLRDFYYPKRLGPAIMAWDAGGPASTIYTQWEAAGFPREKMGDLWWINQLDGGRFAVNAHVLQDMFPSRIFSYKAHRCDKAYPEGASIVCFHGQPKPHNCESDWVRKEWR